MRILFGELDPSTWTAVTLRTPVGPVQVVADQGGVTAVRMEHEAFSRMPAAEGGWAVRAAGELEKYFQGRRRAFTIPLHLSSGLTLFQRAVLSACARIPNGRVLSYGELSQKAGYPGAARAVGQVMARNPVPLFIPCHRVVASGGLGGYGFHTNIKVFLLGHERVEGYRG
jgi:methylated-DNA-[protein]-cysteine S-methyltransferase